MATAVNANTATAADDFGDKNRKYWETQASEPWDADWIKGIMNDITDGLHKRVDWLGFKSNAAKAGRTQIKMLDYACGKGLCSRIFAPWVDTFRGIDISKAMADEYTRVGRELGMDEGKLLAIQGDLGANANPEYQDPALETEDFYNFDLIAMSMALHHIDEPPQLISNLAKRLAPGGILLIIDWTAGEKDNGLETLPPPTLHGGHNHFDDTHQHGNHSHGHDHHHHHHHTQVAPASATENPMDEKSKKTFDAAKLTVSFPGFSPLQMAKMFRDAGCVESDYVENDKSSKFPLSKTGTMQLFFAKGERPQ